MQSEWPDQTGQGKLDVWELNIREVGTTDKHNRREENQGT